MRPSGPQAGQLGDILTKQEPDLPDMDSILL